MAVARMVYIVCDSCGSPASDPEDTVPAARTMVPDSWTSIREGLRTYDYCPSCTPPTATSSP